MGGTGLCGAGNERKRTGPEAGRLGTTACAPCGQRGPCVLTAAPAPHAAALGSVWMDVLSFPKGLVSSQRPLPASPPTSLPRDPEFTHSLTRSLAHPFVYLRFFLCAGHSEGRPRLPSHHRISRVLTRWRVGFPRRRPQLLLGAHGPWCRLCIHWTLYSPLRGSPGPLDSWGHPGPGRSLAGPSSITSLPALHREPEGLSTALGFHMGSGEAGSYLPSVEGKAC